MKKEQREAFINSVNRALKPILEEYEVKSSILLADPSPITKYLVNLPEKWANLYKLSQEYCEEIMSGKSKKDRKKVVEAILERNGERAPWLRHSGALKKRFDVFERDGFKCVYCGRLSSDNCELQVDHVHPKSKGGLDELDNLVTSCFECNIGKSDRILYMREEFKKSLIKAGEKQK